MRQVWMLPGHAGPREATINGCRVQLHGTLIVEIPDGTNPIEEAEFVSHEPAAISVVGVQGLALIDRMGRG